MLRLPDGRLALMRKQIPDERCRNGRVGLKLMNSPDVPEAFKWTGNTGARWRMLPQHGLGWRFVDAFRGGVVPSSFTALTELPQSALPAGRFGRFGVLHRRHAYAR